MDIGRTNKRITFCRYEEKENALSQTEQTLTEVKTVWASVEPTRGREYQEAQRKKRLINLGSYFLFDLDHILLCAVSKMAFLGS